MSRAFTKEDAWEEPVIPPRAALPDGVPNYVTPRGLTLLREELAALEAARQSRNAERGDETERRRGLEIANRRLADLAARIASAEVVDPARQALDQVRFGATVTLRTLQGERTGEERRLTIVGVDEADPDEGRIAFVAPIARAVLGHKVGDIAALRTARGEERLEIVAIAY